MKKIKLGDWVTVLSEPVDSENRKCRVVYVCRTGYYVSSTVGTICRTGYDLSTAKGPTWKFYKKSEVEK